MISALPQADIVTSRCTLVAAQEGDFDWQDIQGTSNSAFCTSIITSGATGAGLSCRTASNWVGTLRARFGYAWDRVLVQLYP